MRRLEALLESTGDLPAGDESGYLGGAPRVDSIRQRTGPGMRGLSILVVEDETALAEGLAAALVGQQCVARAAAASDPDAALSAMAAEDVDVLVVGTDASEWDPVALLRSVTARFPDVAVVAMSGSEDARRVAETLLAGATSWIPKRVSVRGLTAVLLATARGEAYVPPMLLRHVLRRLAADSVRAEQASALTALTEREREVLDYAVLGYTRRAIAGELGLSVNTVRTHLQHVLAKLGLHTTLEAVTLVLRGRANGDRGPAADTAPDALADPRRTGRGPGLVRRQPTVER